jgi:hypothetical protein
VHFLSDPARARRAGDEALASERVFNRERFAVAWAGVFSAEQDAQPSPVHAQSS